MADTVYNSERIKLQDGTEVTLVPLAIGRLRRFMDTWKDGWKALSEKEDADDAEVYDIYINCAGIALSKELGNKFQKPLDSDKVLADDYREYLEDVLDEPTTLRVLEVCGNLRLSDPDLVAEAERLQREQAGTN